MKHHETQEYYNTRNRPLFASAYAAVVDVRKDNSAGFEPIPTLTAMKKSIAICMLLPILMAGCFLGERHSLTRTVSLNFQPLAGASEAGLSLTNVEVQEALKIVDAVLSTNGFVREPRTDMASVPGFVAAYARYESPGLRSGTLPDVYLKQDRLEVEIVELGNRTTRPTALADKVCESLQRELSSRYGRKNVKIRD